MELGQVVDFVLEYNELHNVESRSDGSVKEKEKKEPTKRKATQADWDAFWG